MKETEKNRMELQFTNIFDVQVRCVRTIVQGMPGCSYSNHKWERMENGTWKETRNSVNHMLVQLTEAVFKGTCSIRKVKS